MANYDYGVLVHQHPTVMQWGTLAGSSAQWPPEWPHPEDVQPCTCIPVAPSRLLPTHATGAAASMPHLQGKTPWKDAMAEISQKFFKAMVAKYNFYHLTCLLCPNNHAFEHLTAEKHFRQVWDRVDKLGQGTEYHEVRLYFWQELCLPDGGGIRFNHLDGAVEIWGRDWKGHGFCKLSETPQLDVGSRLNFLYAHIERGLWPGGTPYPQWFQALAASGQFAQVPPGRVDRPLPGPSSDAGDERPAPKPALPGHAHPMMQRALPPTPMGMPCSYPSIASSSAGPSVHHVLPYAHLRPDLQQNGFPVMGMRPALPQQTAAAPIREDPDLPETVLFERKWSLGTKEAHAARESCLDAIEHYQKSGLKVTMEVVVRKVPKVRVNAKVNIKHGSELYPAVVKEVCRESGTAKIQFSNSGKTGIVRLGECLPYDESAWSAH